MRTDDNLKIICDTLQRNCGDLHAAARAAGLSPHFIFNWIRDDAEASKQIEEAQRVGWLGLESAAIQRGVHGVEKAVYFKGKVVGHQTEYSDSLLAKMLEARVPAYKKGEAGGGNHFNAPVQINVMPRAENYEQWLAMKDKTLERRAEEKRALAAPVEVPEILQGEYVEVRDERPLKALEGLL